MGTRWRMWCVKGDPVGAAAVRRPRTNARAWRPSAGGAVAYETGGEFDGKNAVLVQHAHRRRPCRRASRWGKPPPAGGMR